MRPPGASQLATPSAQQDPFDASFPKTRVAAAVRNVIVCAQCGALVLSHPTTVAQHRRWHAAAGHGKDEVFAAMSLIEASDMPAKRFRTPPDSPPSTPPPMPPKP